MQNPQSSKNLSNVLSYKEAVNILLAGIALTILYAVWEFDKGYLLLPRFAWKGYEYYESWIALLIFPVLLLTPPLLLYWWFKYINFITQRHNYKTVVVTNKNLADFYDGKQGFPVPKPISDFVYRRDQGRCRYCWCYTVPSYGFENAKHIWNYVTALGKLTWLSITKNVFKPVRLFEADHVVPEKVGGDGRNPAMVYTSCRKCNRRKGHRIKPPFDFHIFKLLKEQNLTIHQDCL